MSAARSVAALPDIHGNLPALDAVLADRRRDPPDAALRDRGSRAADLVLTHADPDEVAERDERASAQPVPETSLIAAEENPLPAARARSAR